MHRSSLFATTLSVVALGCQATVNLGGLTDTSDPGTSTGNGSASTGGDSGTTNSSTADPNASTSGTTAPNTTDTSTSDPNTTDTSTTGPNTTDTTGSASGTDTDTTGSSTGGGNPNLGDWTKYREILIDNGLRTELTDFQISVKVTYDADMSPDYADLRFTDESGAELLPYWIEWELGPVEAYLWVRVPAIAADDITTIRMYYGNPNATPGTNGFDTFLFFDDFETGQLDASKWKSTAPVTVESGRLKITKGAVYTAKPAAGFPDTTVEVRAMWANEMNVSFSRIGIGQAQQELPDLMNITTGGWTNVWDGKKNIKPQNENACPTDVMNITGISTNAAEIYPRCNRYYSPPIDLGVAFNYYLTLGHGWGKLAELNETTDMDIDWIMVRRHAKPDPVTIVGGEQTP